VFLLVAGFGFTVARLLVVPQSEVPQRADAVVAFDDDDAHVTRALELMNQQVAPVLIVSGGQDPARALSYRLCTQPQPFEVLCPAVAPAGDEAGAPPDQAAGTGPTAGASGAGPAGGNATKGTTSSTARTQAQAQAVGRIATERGWSEMALVGLPEQLSLTRMLMERCTTADVAPVMVETPVSQRFEHLGGEVADYLRALFLDRSC
jgi:hypothetical protein